MDRFDPDENIEMIEKLYIREISHGKFYQQFEKNSAGRSIMAELGERFRQEKI